MRDCTCMSGRRRVVADAAAESRLRCPKFEKYRRLRVEMTEPWFLLAGYTVKRLTTEDVVDLQDLHARCDDYFFLIEGGATRATSAEEDLSATPPGKDLSDKFLLGIYSGESRLVGVLDLIRDYPAPQNWWLGLLMLERDSRGGGLGSRIYEAAQRWIEAQGGGAIHLAVLEQNTRALSFWRSHGFEEQRRATFVAPTGVASPTIVMWRAIPASSSAAADRDCSSPGSLSRRQDSLTDHKV